MSRHGAGHEQCHQIKARAFHASGSNFDVRNARAVSTRATAGKGPAVTPAPPSLRRSGLRADRANAACVRGAVQWQTKMPAGFNPAGILLSYMQEKEVTAPGVSSAR
jgi:hypothetical protein